jgi:hypothetical protein
VSRAAGSRATPVAWAAVMMATAVTCALAGCMTQAPARRTPSAESTLPPDAATWLLARAALAQVSADPVVGAGLGRSLVYEILQPGQLPLPGVDATIVVAFPAVAALEAALAGHRLPAGTRAVLYDPEAWSFTPASEQRDPVLAATTAADLAHAHGLQIIVAPALNLTTVLAPGSSAPRWQRFLDLRLAARIARIADVLELQAQSLERSTDTYANFVREAAAQARTANPGVTVLAGLSTNPPGAAVDSQQLTAAILASWPTTDGYWLNIPDRGPQCPTCNPARPAVGIGALRAVMQRGLPSHGNRRRAHGSELAARGH